MSRFLLLHAFPFDGRMWDAVAERLEGAGHEVAAPNLPPEPGLETLGAWADRLLEDEPGPFVAVGSSMGGYLALELWRRAPERIARLALVGSRAADDSPEVRESRDATIAFLRERGVEELWPGLAERLLPPTVPPAVAERAAEIALAQDTETLTAALVAMRDRPDARPLLAGITVPVLVVRGEEDAVVPLEEVKAVAAAVPHGELVRLAGTGHLPPLEWPEELARRLLRFVEDVP
jgi:pimeloyl-ACP methyl ester carboxylesterase